MHIFWMSHVANGATYPSFTVTARRSSLRSHFASITLLCVALFGFEVEASRDGLKTDAEKTGPNVPFAGVKEEIEGELKSGSEEIARQALKQETLTRNVGKDMTDYTAAVGNIATSVERVEQAKKTLAKAYREEIQTKEPARVKPLQTAGEMLRGVFGDQVEVDEAKLRGGSFHGAEERSFTDAQPFGMSEGVHQHLDSSTGALESETPGELSQSTVNLRFADIEPTLQQIIREHVQDYDGEHLTEPLPEHVQQELQSIIDGWKDELHDASEEQKEAAISEFKARIGWNQAGSDIQMQSELGTQRQTNTYALDDLLEGRVEPQIITVGSSNSLVDDMRQRRHQVRDLHSSDMMHSSEVNLGEPNAFRREAKPNLQSIFGGSSDDVVHRSSLAQVQETRRPRTPRSNSLDLNDDRSEDDDPDQIPVRRQARRSRADTHRAWENALHGVSLANPRGVRHAAWRREPRSHRYQTRGMSHAGMDRRHDRFRSSRKRQIHQLADHTGAHRPRHAHWRARTSLEVQPKSFRRSQGLPA